MMWSWHGQFDYTEVASNPDEMTYGYGYDNRDLNSTRDITLYIEENIIRRKYHTKGCKN